MTGTLNLGQVRLVSGIVLIWMFIISALIGIALGAEQWFISKTPLNLSILALVLTWIYPINSVRQVMAFGIAFITGMCIEILGVQTGLIFGEYVYGGNLGPKIIGVPLLIGVNWGILSFVTYTLSRSIAKQEVLQMIIGALLMVLLDFPMEQVTSRFDYWHWAGPEIPIQNYVAWFIVALFLQWVLNRLAVKGSFTISLHIYLSQVVFFVVSYLVLI